MLGDFTLMQPNNRKLLREAGRTVEMLVGWVCALISIVFSSLFVWLAYIVGLRNPRQYGSHDLLKFDTLGVFAILLAIAVVFSVFAFRLLQKEKPKQRLMSPLRVESVGNVLCPRKCNWIDRLHRQSSVATASTTLGDSS
jgi:drug/metabolite transporter (DMT)-like permease